MNRYDAIIVGCGPAGAAAAIELSRAGLRVCVLEKASFPRDKPCGGALSQKARNCLNIAIPEGLLHHAIKGVRLYCNGIMSEVINPDNIAFTIRRAEFDQFLAHEAARSGSEIHFGEKVAEIARDGDLIKVRTPLGEHFCSNCIVADGAHGTVHAFVREPDSKNDYLLALVAHIEDAVEAVKAKLDHVIEIHFSIMDRGYGWVFPNKGYYSAGIVGAAAKLHNPRQLMADFAAARGLNIGSAAIRAHKVPLGGIRRKVCDENIYLVGDAAGWVDPFLGEGISHAIHSGILAANNIIGHGSTRDYEREITRHIFKDLKLSLLLTKAVYAFDGFLLERFVANKDVIAKYLEIPTAKIGYRQYARWLIARLPTLLF